jgi:hypothetical protein
MNAYADLIDTTHPKWDEIRISTLAVSFDWPNYVGYFNRQQLIDFLEVCSDVISCELVVVKSIINMADKGWGIKYEQAIRVLDWLVELWNYDYTRYDYLDICIQTYRFDLLGHQFLKYFLGHGLLFQEHSIKNAHVLKTEIIEIMINQGLNADAIAKTITNFMKQIVPNTLSSLVLLSNVGVDIIGHMEENV